ITAPIARKDGSTIEREINFKDGESAVTYYERLAYKNGLSLVELHLGTGRTHQIRVHMKYIGHPLPGDFLYNPGSNKISRQALHSYQLEFTHPITGEHFLIQAPIPEDFSKAFQ
ncbi:MAG: RluA family pseudouridine synthase, partial [Lachnospiraceae bacterium]|nr:RluA family pseudouridine synthase [Candidatus Equihabitans merdae]